MKTKHTPGPWSTIRHATPDYAPQYGVYSTNPNSPASDLAIVKGEKSEADAALIAAAPELLEALQDLLFCAVPTGMDTRTDRAMKRAQAVIARATGEAEPS